MNLLGGGASSVSSSGAGTSTTAQQQLSRQAPSSNATATVVADPTPSICHLQRIALNQIRFVEKLGEGQYGMVWKGELAPASSFSSDFDGGESTQVLLIVLIGT